jgi:ketosteroid isomerase-like protein
MNQTKEVLDADSQRRQALLDANVQALSKLIHDDFVQVHATGALESKPSLIAKIDGGGLVYQAIALRETTVDLLSADTALQVSEVLQTVVIAGSPKEVHVRIVSVWVHADDRWRLRSYQGTTIAGPIQSR